MILLPGSSRRRCFYEYYATPRRKTQTMTLCPRSVQADLTGAMTLVMAVMATRFRWQTWRRAKLQISKTEERDDNAIDNQGHQIKKSHVSHPNNGGGVNRLVCLSWLCCKFQKIRICLIRTLASGPTGSLDHNFSMSNNDAVAFEWANILSEKSHPTKGNV